jgi:cell division initiation protein
LDIRQQRFHVRFRGFDPEEVDTFLEMVASEFEALIQAEEASRRELARLREDYKALSRELQSLKEARDEAERQASRLREAVEAEAARIRAQAEKEAQAVLEAARLEKAQAQRAVEALAAKRQEVLRKLRDFLKHQLKLLEEEEAEASSSARPP